MQGKVYLYLFILCTILPEGIFGKFVEDDIRESSNVLDREKRVISRIPGEDVPVDVGEVPYIANIKKNRRLHCLGTIISHYTVITAARCFSLEMRNYIVLSGSTISNKGTPHNITRKVSRGHDPSRSSTFLTGVALIVVAPPFVYRTNVLQIGLHRAPISTGITGTVSGWGTFVYGGGSESRYGDSLRSVNVSIMNHQECRNIYRGYFPISEEDFCAYHAQRLCGYLDTGAPFVVDNTLVGVHIGRIATQGRELPIKPDVFVLLQHPEYSQWINNNIVL